MRFHVFGLPHTITNAEFCACAYTQKVRKFARMMGERGHEVIHYGHPNSDVPGASEHVDVISRETFNRVYGEHDYKSKFFTFSQDDEAYREFYSRAISEVWRRKKKNDFLLPFWGWGHKPICDAHQDVYTVEPGIGYSSGHFAPYKIFESYALYHAYCGLDSSAHCKQNWYEVVIPNYFDLEEFTYQEEKEDYLLFLGRVYDGKGVHIAIQVAEQTGIPLKIAGQNMEFLDGVTLPPHVEKLGYAGIEERKELMAKAKGFILASKYVEPFGGTMVEALLSGTPCITTDWGAMAENNLHGITGYRCRTFDHFVWAANNIGNISPAACRQWGENFSLENVAPMYEEFFAMVLDQGNEKAWYTLHPERDQLDWMTRQPPAPAKADAPQRFNFSAMAEEEGPFAERLAQWIRDRFGEISVADIGCGPGHFTKAMQRAGVDAEGFDLITESEGVSLWDIASAPLEVKREGVLCLEVAEHIPEEKADAVVDHIVQSLAPGGVLIWSAARPGQGGVGHINCQPRQYWLKKFLERGMAFAKSDTQAVIKYAQEGVHMGWFTQNVLIMYAPNVSADALTMALSGIEEEGNE